MGKHRARNVRIQKQMHQEKLQKQKEVELQQEAERLKNLTPQEFVANYRAAGLKKLQSKAVEILEDSVDLPQLVASTRALIRMNKEIWQRCLKNTVEKAPQKEEEKENKEEGLSFHRVGFFAIDVSTPEDEEKLVFQTTSELMVKEFKTFPSPPKILRDILSGPVVPPNEFVSDYEEYLVKATFLNDDILKLFLSILKNHLKEVQVHLGKIDSWLMQPLHSVNFINEQFGTNLKTPKVAADDVYMKLDLDPPCPDLCVKCFHERDQHSPWDDFEDICPIRPELRMTATYFVGEDFELKSIPMSDGEITKTFEICTEAGQIKLTKFLDFATC